MATDDPIYREALSRFDKWFEAVQESEPEPTAMAVATADVDGRLSCRTCLLKDHDERGFVFFTNFDSVKGRQLKAHPRAALCFNWNSLQRQVRIEGGVEVVTDEEADAYFATRPRGSQIGAWASRQSQTLESRERLEEKVAEFERKFEGGKVPRPSYWSGFRVVPVLIEFWQGKSHRLHERWCYELSGGQWARRMLFP